MICPLLISSNQSNLPRRTELHIRRLSLHKRYKDEGASPQESAAGPQDFHLHPVPLSFTTCTFFIFFALFLPGLMHLPHLYNISSSLRTLTFHNALFRSSIRPRRPIRNLQFLTAPRGYSNLPIARKIGLLPKWTGTLSTASFLHPIG